MRYARRRWRHDVNLIDGLCARFRCDLGTAGPNCAIVTKVTEIDPDAWATLNSDTSRPFGKPKSERIAVKVINHLGDEVMKVFRT